MPKVWVPIANVFVAIEGVDGSGKTLTAKLAEQLVHTVDLVPIRQPGTTYIGRRIRKALLTLDGPAPSAQVQQRLFAAAMLDADEQVVTPALAAGKGVLTDRWKGSTYAYGISYGVDEAEIDILLDRIRDPDVTVLLDIDPRIAQGRKAPTDRFDAAGLEMQDRIRAEYLRLAEESRTPWLVLDATQPANDIAWKIASIFVQPELQKSSGS